MDEHELARRRLLKHAAATVPAVVVLRLLGSRGAAHAGTASKEDFHYQDHPNDGKRCAGCTAFHPPPSGQAFGTCNIVAGPVSPDGWCMAFSSK